MVFGQAGRPLRAFISTLGATTALGVCCFAPGVARAQCDVNPTEAYATTTCTGTDTNTLVANTTGTTVNIQSGASVASVYATAPAFNLGYFQPFTSIAIANNGQIAGGLTVNSGPANPYGYAQTTSVNLTVGANASIGGDTAINLIAQTASPYGATASLTLDNQGTIQSLNGAAAITGNGSVNAQVASLTNETTGLIGPISAIVLTLSNSGTISGGGASAIATTTSNGTFSGAMSWQNNGSITSAGAAPTIGAALGNGIITLVNSGQITNSGSGNAISASGSSYSLTISNSGTISSNAFAIQTGGQLNLTSTGSINGSVEADNVGGYGGSTINLSGGGGITGSLTLGQNTYGSVGNTLIVDYASSGNLLSSITGSVTIGGNNNALILNFPGNATLSAPVTLPFEFSSLGLQLASDTTVTLASVFSTPVGLTLSIASPFYGAPATLVNAANIATTGAALIEADPYSQVALVNSGTISANLANAVAGTFAVTTMLAGSGTALTNSGTITGSGGNGAYVFGGASNTGTITADGTALAVYDGTLTNSGTVSGGNTGLVLSGGSGANTGSISGGQIGASLASTTLTNSGTITAVGGQGIALGAYSTLNNQQGGVINGGIGAGQFNNTVNNAGTINGDVSLGGSTYGQTNDTYVSLAGGVLNGNLNLGNGGDKLVVSLVSSGSGTYPGITGSVTGSGTETLLNLVTANGTATLAAPSGVFSIIGYDLANNAALTLTSTAPLNGTYTFAGTGTVNLTADISGNGVLSLLNLTAASMQSTASGTPVPTALNFTSTGNLTVAASGTGAPPAAAVTVGTGSTFTNTGTISYTNAVTPPPYAYYGPAAAIVSTGTVTNSGTIEVGGGAAIVGGYSQTATTVVNTGSIVQIVGAADATGIVDVNAVTNSGTIATGGTAVVFQPGYINTLINSGTITSTDSAAIGTDPASYTLATATITNNAGGTIGGGVGQPAIVLATGSAVVNSGTINGDVQLGLQGYNYVSGSTYVANGGTLNGNLIFGSTDNTLLVIGATTGITGTITPGSGTNLYAQAFSASTGIDLSTLALPPGFQNYGVGAIGAGTVLTITGPASGFNSALTVFGDGTVINNANINSGLFGGNAVVLGGSLNALLGDTGAVTFINTGTIADGVTGSAQSFTNSGTVGTQISNAGVTLTAAAQPTFVFNNSGQIWGAVNIAPNQLSQQSVTITNSGTISGDMSAFLNTNTLTLINSGTIDSTDITAGQSGGLFTATNAATGVIKYGFGLYVLSNDIAFTNAGQINLYLGLAQNLGTQVDQNTASVENSGTISGFASLQFNSTSVSVTNTGSITSLVDPINGSYGGVLLSNSTAGNSTVTFTNSGTLADAIPGQAALQVSVIAGNSMAPANTAVTVTNTGSIAANGGGVYVPFFLDQFVTTGLTVAAYAPGGTASITIANAAGASISANGANNASYGEFGPGTVPTGLESAGSVALFAAAPTVSLSNAGTITGGGDIVLSGNNFNVQINGLSLPTALTTIAGAIDLVGDTASLTNTGTITGNTILFAPTATFANYGTVNGNVTLGTGVGTGTASVVEGINATLTGTVTGTAAVNTLTFDVTGGGVLSQALLAQFIGFQAPHLTGDGAIGLAGPLPFQTLVLDNAALTLAAGQVLQTAGPIAITGGAGTNSFTNFGTVDGAIVNVATTNGAGGVINIATTATTDAPLTNSAGARLNISTGTFTINGLMTNGGAVTVAGGATLDAVGGIANASGGIIFVQAGATVNDALVNAGTVIDNGVYNADIVNQSGGMITATGPVTAPNSISSAGIFAATGATVSTPLFANLAGGVLSGSLTFSTPGGTLLTNQGTIGGTIAFGAGSNELLLGSGSNITGTITGGSGSNLLAIMSSASDAAPDQFTLTGVTGFQQSQLLSGSVALSGGYTTGSFAVLGGHLIGNAGSVLTASTITVAAGAAFGSAGVVNANVTVNGILAPVGTMNVNGNVALGAGSNFLIMPSGSQLSQLDVNGKVSIAGGATLTFANALSQRQGSFAAVLSASGGISGAFSITGVPGAYDLIATGNLIEVYRPFVAGAGFGSGATVALDRINALVVSGLANTSLIADLAVLSNAQGLADAGKFARLTPEPYATATQIGIDNGLQIADTLRDYDNDTAMGPAGSTRHAFTFAEALGNWTRAPGNPGAGSATATDATGGLFGGLGWRGDHAMASLFVGGIHGQQTIAALGVETLAHSTLFGLNALAWRGGFDASATLAADNGIGDTTRALPDGTTTWSRYGLRALMGDIAIGYTIHGPSGWTMHPQIGLTHITVHRDAADELASAAFALNVAGERRKIDFVDAAWRFAPPTTAASRFMPWAGVGLRVRLDGDVPQATGYLPGASDPIAAPGAFRARTVVTGKAGFSYAITSTAALYASYDGERGNGSNTNAVNGGVRLAF